MTEYHIFQCFGLTQIQSGCFYSLVICFVISAFWIYPTKRWPSFEWLIDCEWVTNWQINWSIDWQIDWLMDWLSDITDWYVTDWVNEWMTVDQESEWLIEWLIDWLFAWLGSGFHQLDQAWLPAVCQGQWEVWSWRHWVHRQGSGGKDARGGRLLTPLTLWQKVHSAFFFLILWTQSVFSALKSEIDFCLSFDEFCLTLRDPCCVPSIKQLFVLSSLKKKKKSLLTVALY